MQPISTAPTEPVDFLGYGPLILVHREPSDGRPVLAWWSKRDAAWRSYLGRLPFMPAVWQAAEPRPKFNEADFRALERLRNNKSNCFAF